MNIPEIPTGQIFSVDGKLYCITKPTMATETTNDHGHIVILLDRLQHED